jgi:hypothetical protein
MGKIDMPIFQSKKCEVPVAPRVPKPLEINLIFNFEQLLLNKHFKIRSTSEYIHSQSFHTFSFKTTASKYDLQTNLLPLTVVKAEKKS